MGRTKSRKVLVAVETREDGMKRAGMSKNAEFGTAPDNRLRSFICVDSETD
jgi:hypothetical protein